MNITEQDIANAAKLLNFVATKAEFKLNTAEVISYYHLLNWAQTQLIPKLEANVFEIKQVKAPKEKK